MIIGLSGLGCADCFGTCGDGIAGLGTDPGGPAAYGPVNGKYVTAAEFEQWQRDTLAANTSAAAAGLAQFLAANPVFVGMPGTVSLQNSYHTCPSGYEWDGLNGLGSLGGCRPTQATLDAKAAETARVSAATLLAAQKAAQQKAIDDAAVAAAYQARVTAAKAACGTGYEWDGVLNGLSGCKLITPAPIPVPVPGTNTTPPPMDTVAQPFDFTTFIHGTYFGVPTWMLLVGAGGGLYLATKGGR